MAFISSAIKAKCAGSGKSPSIFTYGTDDTKAVVQGANYFKEGAGFLSLGDIIFISYDVSTEPYVVSAVNIVSDGDNVVNVQAYHSFVGDTRDTDGAGCRVDGLSQAFQGGEGLFGVYTYRNNTDTVAVQGVADYFIEAGLFLNVGDIIMGVAIDGAYMARVLTSGVNGVTLEEIVFAP